MKMTTKYNLKKGLLILGMGALTFTLVNCSKDDPTPNNRGGNGGDTPQPQKHNVELIMSDQNQYQNIAMDTIYKYNADPNVDTIFMVPEYYNMWSTLNTEDLHATRNYLYQRHNVNPNRVFGKGELQLNADAVRNNPEITRFFRDTLGYYVTYYTEAKHR